MSNDETYRLALGLAVTLGGSGIVYLMGVVWGKLVARVFGIPPSPKSRKMWATVCLVMPIWVVVSILRKDYDDLREWWVQTPAIVSLSFLLVVVIVFAVLTWVAIRLWRAGERAPSP